MTSMQSGEITFSVQPSYRGKARNQLPKAKACPKCGWVGQVLESFGIRVLRGKARPQSWCYRCRSAK